MDNFKFKVNGIQTNIQAVSEPFHPGTNNGYGIGTISGFNTTTSSPEFQVDGTNGQAGNATCNKCYMKNSYDIFKSIGGFSSNVNISNDYGALARYHFFKPQNSTYNFNNIAIPEWASYIRVFLIGAGGGGAGGGGGGAGEFVFMESECTGGSTYSIEVGQGGSGYSGYGNAGGGTSLYNIGNEPISAEGGSGGPFGAGGSAFIGTYPFQYPVAKYTRTDDATVIRAKGESGSAVAGGQRTDVQYYYNYYSLDSWFGFEMSGSTQQQLVSEMINGGYGRGGYGSAGENGCACVFYFGVKPSHLVFPQGFFSNIYSDGT